MTLSLVQNLVIVLAAGLVATIVCRRLSVSVLIGYLVIGAIIGQGGFGWVLDHDHQLGHLAELGVFLLLFTIGLEFPLEELKRLGLKLLVAGSLQLTLAAAPTAAVLLCLGMSWQSTVLLSAAVAFSSTVLVFRALSETGQAQTRHGRRAIGILLFQDAALLPLLLMIPMLTHSSGLPGLGTYVRLTLTSLGLIVAITGLRYLLGKWISPLFASLKSVELMVLATVVCFSGVSLATYSAGLPPAIGSFAAGLVFNGTRWSHQIDALVLPFRETFTAIFFVGLGLLVDLRLIWQEPSLLALTLPAVIVLKTFAGATALWLTGLPIRDSAAMGLGLAHIGEFAFVLALLGVEAGAISAADYMQLVIVAVGSLVLAPLLLTTGLRFIKASGEDWDQDTASDARELPHRRVIIIGAGPLGRSMASQLETTGSDVCLIDLSPVNLHAFAQDGFRTIVGDAAEPDTLRRACVEESELIVVGVSNDAIAQGIVRSIRSLSSTTFILVRCQYISTESTLRRLGANAVVADERESALALMRRIPQSLAQFTSSHPN